MEGPSTQTLFMNFEHELEAEEFQRLTTMF